MSALQRSRRGVSRRDVGAGLVAGVAALLANVLFHAAMMARVFISDPATVLADPDIVLSIVQLGPLTALPLVVAPVAALVVGTVVWRIGMPDEPAPRRGAGAGVVTAFGSLVVLALVFGVIAGLSAISTAPFDAVGEFFVITMVVFVFGTVITASVIAPVGALVGYGYEWSLARRE
ncbi:hypothetical protein [Haloarcula salinisoli]|uniref:Uncharacterized protein n=1 Tax=Haloarcula salinisoli TaxID=2487746 RepID=A0A8J8CE60_9EURY|nr:hypothetical protein [Halomicroarcula salinisoli]MBX0305320.1 hypothetical protein [Halomicroarcula salinisoli]